MKFGKIGIRQAALCVALAVNLGGSKIPPPGLPGNQLRSITTLNSGRQVVVTFHAEGDYRFEKFELENPKRLVIDLIRLRNAVRPNIIRINSESLQQINVSQLRNQNPPITRVTMSLGGQNPAYTVARQGSRVQVVFGAAAQKVSPPTDRTASSAAVGENLAPDKPAAASVVTETPTIEPATATTGASESTSSQPAPAVRYLSVPEPEAAATPGNQAATPAGNNSTPAATKLPAVSNSSSDFFKARSLKVNPRQIRVQPYLDRPFGAEPEGTSNVSAQKTAENPPKNSDAPATPAPEVVENAAAAVPAEELKAAEPAIKTAEKIEIVSVPSAPSPLMPKAAPAAAPGSNQVDTIPAKPPTAPAKPPAINAEKDHNTGKSGSTRIQVSDARSYSRPMRITTADGNPSAVTSKKPAPGTAGAPVPQASGKSAGLPPADTADRNPDEKPKQPALPETVQIKSEDAAPANPVLPITLPAGSPENNLATGVAAAVPPAALPASAPSNGEVEPTSTANPAAVAAPERKRGVPIQMSPEAALSKTLATGNTPTIKAPAGPANITGKSSSRLPVPKSGARPASPAPGGPKAEPVGLPQQLSTPRTEERGAGGALQQLQPRPPESTQYSGEAIDLKVKDLDLVDFFRMMAEISGLNVSVDPDVGGKITMSMGAVPWDQIFDLALLTHRLEKKIDGNVVRVAKKDTFQSEETSKKSMRQAVEDAQDTQYMSFRLNYADAKSLSESLKDQLSSRGQVISDERTNTVIVSDLPKKLLGISQLVKTLDVPEPQVIIESRVVQATRSFAREIGVTLGFVVGNGERVTVGAPSMASTQIPGLLNNNVNLAATRQNGVLGVKVGNVFDTFALDAAISAGEQKGIARLLSEPKVTAQNNREAIIRQGVRFPVQVVQNNTVSVIFQDAALTLKVTPKITDAGTVLLNLRVENNVADFTRSVNGIPSIQTSESETRVLIPNGGTTVIGGILVDEDRSTDDKVPGMASIPLFGHLFKRRSTEKRTQEILFFVTPRIDR